MFTAKHFIWLAFCAAFIIIGVILAKKKRMSRQAATYVMMGVCLFSETSKYLSEIVPSEAGGYILDPGALPFHLCSLLVFAVFYIGLTHNEKGRATVTNFLAPCGVAGGIMALLIPTSGVDFLDIAAYQCFVYHAGLVWYALVLIVNGYADMSFRSYLRNIAIMAMLALGSLYVNSILSVYGTNFMFTSRPPLEGLPILNLDHGWLPYFLTLVAAGFVLLGLVYLAGGRRKKSCE